MGIVGRICSAVSAVVLVAGCGGAASNAPVRDDAGLVIEGGTVEAFDLQLGDCFNDPGSIEVELVPVVACTVSHDFEVYYLFELADGGYPGPDVLEDQWIQGCLAEFETFVGISFDESMLDISAIFPTEQSWEDLGDREVLCSVTAVDGTPRTASAWQSSV